MRGFRGAVKLYKKLLKICFGYLVNLNIVVIIGFFVYMSY